MAHACPYRSYMLQAMSNTCNLKPGHKTCNASHVPEQPTSSDGAQICAAWQLLGPQLVPQQARTGWQAWLPCCAARTSVLQQAACRQETMPFSNSSLIYACGQACTAAGKLVRLQRSSLAAPASVHVAFVANEKLEVRTSGHQTSRPARCS